MNKTYMNTNLTIKFKMNRIRIVAEIQRRIVQQQY